MNNSPSSAQSEREAFEALMRSRGEDYLYRRDVPGCEKFGEYCRQNVQDQWEVWQARAAASAQATLDCHVCGFDCAGANPLVTNCPLSPDAREAGGGVTLSADRIEQIMSLVEQHGDYRWAHCIGGRGYDAKKAVETRDRIRAILREAGSGGYAKHLEGRVAELHDAMARDAERYRWIRRRAVMMDYSDEAVTTITLFKDEGPTGEFLDDQIDGEIAKEKR